MIKDLYLNAYTQPKIINTVNDSQTSFFSLDEGTDVSDNVSADDGGDNADDAV